MRGIFQKIYIFVLVLFKEPLLQFLFFGAIIFLAAEVTADRRDNQQRVIIVDVNLENHLKNLYSNQFGAYPDKDALDHLVDNYVRDEVMYREALRMGLADKDEIIRRRLVQKMEYLLSSAADIKDPGEEVLTAWYRKHAADFSTPATVTFRHLYFSNDSDNNHDARQRAEEALHLINSEHEQQALQITDKFPLNDHYGELSRHDARQLFGRTEFVQKLFTVPVGHWSGPYRSGYGWHLILIRDRTDQKLPPFTDVKDRILTAWRDEYSNKHFESVLNNLMDKYKIRRAGIGGAE